MTALTCTCIRAPRDINGLLTWTIAIRDDECPQVEHRTRVGA